MKNLAQPILQNKTMSNPDFAASFWNQAGFASRKEADDFRKTNPAFDAEVEKIWKVVYETQRKGMMLVKHLVGTKYKAQYEEFNLGFVKKQVKLKIHKKHSADETLKEIGRQEALAEINGAKIALKLKEDVKVAEKQLSDFKDGFEENDTDSQTSEPETIHINTADAFEEAKNTQTIPADIHFEEGVYKLMHNDVCIGKYTDVNVVLKARADFMKLNNVD